MAETGSLSYRLVISVSGFPEETDIMMPKPSARMTPIAIHIGDMFLRTPVCHSARPTP